jgi:diguanylate cyclase (GGDEF)-like protein/PAS domain S-box-containing protein
MDVSGSSSDQSVSVTPQGRSAHVRWVRVLALTVAFFLVCTIVGAIAIGIRVAGGFTYIRDNWTTFRANVDSRVAYIGNVHDAFGTNRLAKRYQDYVRKRTPIALGALQETYAEMQSAILIYESLALTDAEGLALDVLRTVLARDAEILESAAAVSATDMPPDDIKVFADDRTLAAIKILKQELAKASDKAGANLDRTMMYGINLMSRSSWILPILILASLLLIWLLHRLVSETENRTRAEVVLRESEERFRDLYDNAPNAYYSVRTEDGVIARSNFAFARMLGWPAGGLDGLNFFDLFADTAYGRERAESLFEQLRNGEIVRGIELQMKHKTGRMIWTALTAEPVLDESGKVIEVRSIDIDITDRKRAEEEVRAVQDELVRRANYDELTGLPNRTLLIDRLSQALIRAQRQKDSVGLMFIDLDRFKHINDTYGHDVGDRLLKDAAQRLRSCVREGDTVARLAGDEFVIVLSSISNQNDAALVAGKIIASFGVPFQIGSIAESVSASVGVSVYPEHGEDLHSLLRNADAAMYAAKQNGRNTFRFYVASDRDETPDQPRIEDQLRRALEDDELGLQYQPVVDARSQRVVGVEALLRWDSKVLGEVDPLRFIPVAEAQGTIVAIGEWVLRMSCDQMFRWRADYADHDISLNVNVSSKQISGGHIVSSVKRALALSGLPASLLELEVTENLIIEQGLESMEVLNQLTELGVRLGVDDFGTGYSSLMYIKRYPFSYLKLDQSFIIDIARDGQERTLAKAVIDLAHGLGLVVTAEGVESKEQFETLLSIGCDRVQGNYFCAPGSPDAFIQFLEKANAAAST